MIHKKMHNYSKKTFTLRTKTIRISSVRIIGVLLYVLPTSLHLRNNVCASNLQLNGCNRLTVVKKIGIGKKIRE